MSVTVVEVEEEAEVVGEALEEEVEEALEEEVAEDSEGNVGMTSMASCARYFTDVMNFGCMWSVSLTY